MAPVTSRMRSASVDFPWSTWAMMEKFRMRLGSVGMSGRHPEVGAPVDSTCADLFLGSPAGRFFRGRRFQGSLARQGVLVLLQHQVDTLSDIDGHRHLRPRMQQVKQLILLG